MLELIENYINIIIVAVTAAATWFSQILFFKYKKSEERIKNVQSEVDTIERLLASVKELSQDFDLLHREYNQLKIKFAETEMSLRNKDAEILYLKQEIENIKIKWDK